MTTIYAIHKTDADRLQKVIDDMRTLGAPKLEVVDCGDHYMALEGSHRLAAAKELGLMPELTIYAQDDLIDVAKYDWYDSANWLAGQEAGQQYTAGEVAGELYGCGSIPYSFEN